MSIVCADNPNEHIITIHKAVEENGIRKIKIYDPCGGDTVWGHLEYKIDKVRFAGKTPRPGPPYFTIYGIYSRVSKYTKNPLYTDPEAYQKGVGAVLMYLAGMSARRQGYTAMFVYLVVGKAKGFYRKVGFSEILGECHESDHFRGETATVVAQSLAEARKNKWSV